MNTLSKINLVIFITLTQACGKNIGLLKNDPQINSLRQSINQEAEASLTIGDLSVFKGTADSRSRYFRDEASTRATAHITYTGVQEVPQDKVPEESKGNRFFVPTLKVTTKYINYNGPDIYEFPETTLYLTGVSNKQAYFNNLEKTTSDKIGHGNLTLSVAHNGRLTFYEMDGSGSSARRIQSVVTYGGVSGNLYKEVVALLPLVPTKEK